MFPELAMGHVLILLPFEGSPFWEAPMFKIFKVSYKDCGITRSMVRGAWLVLNYYGMFVGHLFPKDVIYIYQFDCD